MVEQVLVHEVPVALVVGPGQTTVLVEVDGGDLGEAQIADLVPVLDQALVGAHGGAAGGQTQNAVGLGDDLGSDDVGGLAGHFGVVLGFDDSHGEFCSFLIIKMVLVEGTEQWDPGGQTPAQTMLYYHILDGLASKFVPKHEIIVRNTETDGDQIS